MILKMEVVLLFKRFLGTVLCTVLMLLIPCMVSAAENIIETPDIKIIIDGKAAAYKDVPLSVSNRTMLPLREILTNLGVANDDEHIVWDNLQKSVTIYKDNVKIFLKVGSTEAFVNDAPITLDVAPLGYINQRVYIPARFVSQALGKKVLWDGATKAVFIRDEAEYNEVKEILDKSDAAMKEIEKYRLKMKLNSTTSNENMNLGTDMNISADVDNKNKRMYMGMEIVMVGMNMKIESYFADNATYTYNPFTDGWQKQTLPEDEYTELFGENGTALILASNDFLAAGLAINESEAQDEILLKGDVYMNELLEKAAGSDMSEFNFDGNPTEYQYDRYNMEICLDKATYRIKKMSMEIQAATIDEETRMVIGTSFNLEYSDYNGKFTITVPEEVKKKAVEQ
jgi:hypothetical protein